MKQKVKMYDVVNSNADNEFEQRLDANPEIKHYLICIAASIDSGESDSWVIVQGRTSAFNYIKDNIDIINFEESFILVDGLPLSERRSIYAFMQYAQQFYPEDSFDIVDYVKGDWDEEDYRQRNEIYDIFKHVENKLSMEDIMNGNIKFNKGGD